MVSGMNDTPLHAFRIERSGPLSPESQMVLSQVLSTSLSTAAAGTTMSAHCTPEGTIERVFTSSGANAVDRAFQIAKAFNSRSGPVDPPTLAASHIAALEYGPDSALAAATQAGTSLTSVAEAIDAYLTSGEWIAVSVRKPEPKERSRWNIWHDFHRPGAVSTHSRRSDAVIVSIYAGSHAPDRAQNALRQFHSALGGFELIPETQVLDGRDERRPLWRVAGLSALVGGVATAGRYFWDSIEQTIGTPLASSIEPALIPAQLLGLGVAAVASAVAVLHQYGYLPSAAKQARALLEDGLAPAPAKRSGSPKKPKAATTSQKVVDGVAQLVETPRQDGDYPLAARSFMVGSELAAAVLLPGSSARSGVASAASRELPSAVRSVHGPEIGTSDGQVAKLSFADLWAGVFVIGKPGSGKSKLLEWLWAWMQSQLTPLHHAKQHTAYDGAMIAFDTKDDGQLTRGLSDWSAVTGVHTTVIDIAADTPMPLSIFSKEGTLRQRSERVLDALSYLIGEAAGPRFRETAGTVIPLSLLVDAAVTNDRPWLPKDASLFACAHILTGAAGTDRARELFMAIRERHMVESADDAVRDAIEAGANLYGERVTDSQFKSLVESTRNKLDSLTYTEQFWRAGQRDDAADWKYLLTTGQSVVFNFEGLGERAVSDVAQLIMFTLRSAIQDHCKGFQQQGRSVTLLADEASVVAEHSSAIIEWLRSKGRSFGCRMIFATQQPKQLPEEVRHSLLGYSTKIIFGQNDAPTLRNLSKELSTGGEAWSESDIKNLPRYHAIVSTEVEQQGQPTFTVAVTDFTGRDPRQESR